MPLLKIKTTFALLVFISLLSPAPASAETRPEPIYCTYEHLALFKAVHADKEEFDGVVFPQYIGYVKTISRIGDDSIVSIEFIKKTDLPIPRIERVFEDLEETGAVHLPYMAPVPISGEYEFWHRLQQKLGEEGAKLLESEITSFQPFHEPKLSAEDFEFEDICVYRPFDDPPELCRGLKVKLKNDPLAKQSEK